MMSCCRAPRGEQPDLGIAAGRDAMAQHRHQRHDPRAAPDEQQRAARGRLPDEVAADRAAQLELVAGPQLVDEIRRDLAVVEALDGEHERSLLGRRRDRVAALRLVAVLGGQPDVDVLAGPVAGPAGAASSTRLLTPRRLLDASSTTSASCQVSRPRTAARATGRRSCGSRSPPRSPARRRSRSCEAAHPLRALPEVEVRHEQPRRAAVLGLERLAVVAERDPRLAARDVLEREVGRVAAVAERDDELGRRLDAVEQRVDRDALPARVELRPLRHAVDVLRDASRSAARGTRPRSSAAARRSRPAIEKLQLSSGVCGVGPGREHREVGRHVLAGRHAALLTGLGVATVESAGDERHADLLCAAAYAMPASEPPAP